jgi:transposase
MTNHKNLIDQIELQGYNKVQLSKALGVSYITVYRWYKADKIKPVNIRRLEKALSEAKQNSKGLLIRYDTAELLNELKRRGLTITIK